MNGPSQTTPEAFTSKRKGSGLAGQSPAVPGAMFALSPVRLSALLVVLIAISIIITLGLVSAMSLFFYGHITREFVLTGFVASLLTSGAVLSLVFYFVRQLQAAQAALSRSHEDLESCVLVRTQQLQYVNDALRREIREREQAESERRRLEATVQQAQKMEAVGQLAGGVAHDFNNIICAISLNASLAIDDLPEDSPARLMVRDIAEASQRAAALTKQLLSFSKRQIIEPRLVSLNDLIQDLVSMLTRLISEDIILEFAPAPELWTVRADPNQLEQVIINLAINARDAMPEGGVLRLRTQNIVRHDLVADSTNASEYILLSMDDTGCGIHEDILDRIFEPFFTTKSSAGGTGLGLAMVMGIVKQSQGHLEVSSTCGEGTSFRILLPRDASEAELLPALAHSHPAEADSCQATLLVVEDDKLIRKQITRILRRQGHQVLTAASGQEALQLYASHPEHIDLVLTDVVMPHMDGPELARQLRESTPTLRVLFTSGYDPGLMAPEGILDAGVNFIAKPFTRAELLQKVQDVLAMSQQP